MGALSSYLNWLSLFFSQLFNLSEWYCTFSKAKRDKAEDKMAGCNLLKDAAVCSSQWTKCPSPWDTL